MFIWLESSNLLCMDGGNDISAMKDTGFFNKLTESHRKATEKIGAIDLDKMDSMIATIRSPQIPVYYFQIMKVETPQDFSSSISFIFSDSFSSSSIIPSMGFSPVSNSGIM